MYRTVKTVTTLMTLQGSITYGLQVITKYLSKGTSKILYFSNFESILIYGIIFWGRYSYFDKIFVVQKREIHILNWMKFKDSCRSIFKANGKF